MRRASHLQVLAVAAAAIVAQTGVSAIAGESAPARLVVTTTTADLEAITRRVGGGEVATVHLFRGCILRPDLAVEPAAMSRLLEADAVVWSGFFGESSAVHAAIRALPAERRGELGQPFWIDVSRDTARVNVPVSSCEAYVDVQFMHGNPLVWLNPGNGPAIARNIAEGLARLRPERGETFRANAEVFAREVSDRIEVWRRDLAGLADVKVFFTHCGWSNLARLGGPTFITCRKTPGSLPPAELLAGQLAEQGVDVIVLDPSAPPEYGEAFRRRTTARVLTVPSSLSELPGATEYAELFDNLVRRLREAQPAPKGDEATPRRTP
ncbi:MAG: metal ABC transporter substrate-binding protein [Thermoanaerobaculaceae bacterium]|nr:metal ABC transporter substrate-binding protein [Thermoanaerobaculaceae bacterium]